ncbi:MAG: FecR domain-containing protein [Candidatus Marinimicrobia bacterium]|nr:FecR domain-containing protein [Candidatus Neomarinimicrobiota bacterium]
MKKLNILMILLLAILFIEQGFAVDKIALTLKARGITQLKRSTEKDFKPNLKVGTSLFSKDHIKTGKNGYAVLVFLDDKSQIKIRENSEMVISGERQDDAISKTISMQFGTLKAEVSPQRKGEFIIATPTSVASVKGTVFWVVVIPGVGDIFYGVEGSIEVTNNESGTVIVVGADQTGTSAPDGDVGVEDTEEGDPPEEEEEEEEETEPTNTLEFPLQNDQGDVKNVKVEYK